MTSSLEGEGGGLDTPQKWWRHLVMTWWQGGGGGAWVPPKSDDVIYEQPLTGNARGNNTFQKSGFPYLLWFAYPMEYVTFERKSIIVEFPRPKWCMNIIFQSLQKMSKVGSRGFDNWRRCGKSFRRCFDNCQSLERVHDTVRQSLSGRHVSHLTSGRCAFSYVLTSYISLMPLQVRGAKKNETEKSRRSMLTKGANPIELYNQQNIRFVIKHFELQIYLIAQIKLWSTRSELLVTKMSLHSTLCVYAYIIVYM